MLDSKSRENRTVKVNVAWGMSILSEHQLECSGADENDYQIDAGSVDGVVEYKRIIDRNAQLGATHIVYEPRNTKHATRFNSTGQCLSC